MVRIDKPAGVNSSGSIGSAKRKRSSKGSSASGSTHIHINNASALREKAKVLLTDISEARLERVEDIRDALESGNYQISEQDIAVQIVTNALGEKPW